MLGRYDHHVPAVLAAEYFEKIEAPSKRLVWFEQHATMEQAILREKRIKKWLRAWKIELIEKDNLGWRDLAEDLGFPPLEPTGSPLSRG